MAHLTDIDTSLSKFTKFFDCVCLGACNVGSWSDRAFFELETSDSEENSVPIVAMIAVYGKIKDEDEIAEAGDKDCRTLRWNFVSSVGRGTLVVFNLEDHSILEVIPP